MIKFLSAAALCLMATTAMAQDASVRSEAVKVKCKTADFAGNWLVILSQINAFSDTFEESLTLEPTRCTIKVQADGSIFRQSCASFRGFDVNRNVAIVPFSIEGNVSAKPTCTLSGNLTIRYSEVGQTQTIERSLGGALSADKSDWLSLVTTVDKLSEAPGVAQAIRLP